MAVHPLEAYLKHMLRIHAIGEATDETSSYPAIAALLNEAGKDLKPKVRCVLQLKNRGAGHPDGGLFSQDQWQQRDEDEHRSPSCLLAYTVLPLLPPPVRAIIGAVRGTRLPWRVPTRPRATRPLRPPCRTQPPCPQR